MQTQIPERERRILVVDDEPTLRGLCTMLLADWGYRSMEASDGQEAWEQLEQTSVDAVLLDVNMPRLRGDALLARLRRAHPELPVIIMSSDGGDTQRDMLSLGASSFLAKPFRPTELKSHIAQALR